LVRTVPTNHGQGYYRANHALARITRAVSHGLWTPAVEANGIPLARIVSYVTAVHAWGVQWLAAVGVPTATADWDFISAISACASDATFHLIWVVLFNAVDDFGVREANELPPLDVFAPPETRAKHQRVLDEIEVVKEQLLEEALHGALRIAGLVPGLFHLMTGRLTIT
jgi:hypothetical protein